MAESIGQVAYVFPGQGSHRVGMGWDFYHSSPQAQAVFEEADQVLGFPLSRLCFEGPEPELVRTINAQPAIFTVSVAALRAASADHHPALALPSFVAGHSLGEYTALVAADVLDFSHALRLVRERGRLMEEAGAKRPGGMAAILGLDETLVEAVCQETGAQIANINCAGQIVISGSHEALARAMDLSLAQGARRVVPLNVSGGFHSVLMGPALAGMVRAVSSFPFRCPAIPIVANTTAQPLASAEAVKAELLRQLCNCVYWQRSVEYMLKKGVSTFIEFGPGRVLTGLIKRIEAGVQTINISDDPQEPRP